MEITAKVQMKKWERVLNQRGRVGRRAMAQGFNRLGKQTRNVGSRSVTKEYNITKQRVDGALVVTRLAREDDLRFEITAFEQTGGIPARRVPGLATFKAKQLGKSVVSFKIKKRGGRKKLQNAIKIKGAKGTKRNAKEPAEQVFEKQGSEIKTVPRKGSYKGRRLTRTGKARRAGQKMTREKLEKVFGPSVRGMVRETGLKSMRKYVRQNRSRIINNSMRRFMAPARRK